MRNTTEIGLSKAQGLFLKKDEAHTSDLLGDVLQLFMPPTWCALLAYRNTSSF